MGKALRLSILIFMLASVSSIQAENHWIVVKGESEITVEPDELRFNIEIKTWDKDIERAKQENDKLYNKVQDIFSLFSISSENLEASSFSIKPIYGNSRKATDLKGFDATRIILVKLNNIREYDNIVDVLLNAGIYRLSNLRYLSSKKDELFVNARQEALKKAQLKARRMASVYGMNIGKPLEINEGGVMFQGTGFDVEYGSSTSSIVAIDRQRLDLLGKAKIKASVSVKFELID